MSLDKTQLRHGEQYYSSELDTTAYWDKDKQLFIWIFLTETPYEHFNPDRSTGNNIKNIIPDNA